METSNMVDGFIKKLLDQLHVSHGSSTSNSTTGSNTIQQQSDNVMGVTIISCHIHRPKELNDKRKIYFKGINDK